MEKLIVVAAKSLTTRLLKSSQNSQNILTSIVVNLMLLIWRLFGSFEVSDK